MGSSADCRFVMGLLWRCQLGSWQVINNPELERSQFQELSEKRARAEGAERGRFPQTEVKNEWEKAQFKNQLKTNQESYKNNQLK